MKNYNLAVVGATGNVGREILNILEQRSFPIKKIHALASKKSEGTKLSYGNDKEIIVQKLESFDLTHETVKAKMKERYGDNIPLDEIVISPAQMFDSELLITIE